MIHEHKCEIYKGGFNMHEKMLWYNDNNQYMFHGNIMEYDMVAASVSVSERFNLLDKSVTDQLKLLPKEKREIKMGLLQRDNPEFSSQLLSGIRDIRRKFIETNKIDEHDIMSLHSDAIIFNSTNKIVSIIEGVELKHKQTWSSYVRYNRIEMFYNDGELEYKGISGDSLNQHTMGIHKHLLNVFSKLDNYDDSVISYLSRFQTQYLQDKLPDYYYIPFGKVGMYKMDNLELLAYIANIASKEVHSW